MVDVNKAVIEFKNNEELNIRLREWQELLFLDNWLIKAELVSICYNADGIVVAGKNEFKHEHMTSKIEISTEQRGSDLMLTYCEEKVLVHELLHLKYNWLEAPNSYEGHYVDCYEHQLLEQMARTLIITRYRLDKDWFNNIKITN